MKKVKTDDGSFTFYSEEFNQHYHTLAGGFGEALEKHVRPSLAYFEDGVVILDFCFGLGYNSFVALKKAEDKGISFRVIAIENDLKIIQELRNLDLGEYDPIKKRFLKVIDLEPKKKDGVFIYETKDITLLIGDAEKSLPLLSEFSRKIGVVYFDPFSRSVCPQLWDEIVFRQIFSCMGDSSILTTYSCSKVVRRAMENAGFNVIDGPVFGRKAPGTIAYKGELKISEELEK